VARRAVLIEGAFAEKDREVRAACRDARGIGGALDARNLQFRARIGLSQRREGIRHRKDRDGEL
jgi:hypothetical protein